MKRCPKCFGSIRRMGHIEKPFYCPKCKKWFSNEEVTPKQTNADKIRSMTNEELAEMLNHVQGDGFLIGIGQRKMSAYGNWLEWLKRESEGK